MGPFRSFGNIFWQSHLPHPTPSATFISGPMHNLCHFSQWVHMGFPELLDKIARGLLRVHRPISASLCVSRAWLPLMSTQNLWLNITCVSSQQPMLTHRLNIYIQISMMSHYEWQLKPYLSVTGIIFKLDVEPVCLNLNYRICLILHLVRHHPSICVF